MRSTRVKCRPAWLVWSVMGFILLVVVLLPPYSQAAFGLTSRRPPPLAPPPLPSAPPISMGVPLARNDPSSQKWDAENDDASPPQPSLLEEILRRLRGDFSHPLTESTRLVVHYDCRDYRSGLRGLGLRHVWRDVGLSLLSDEDTATDAALPMSLGPALGEQGWRTWCFPWEIRGGVSVKRIQGVSVPQFWRMRRVRGAGVHGRKRACRTPLCLSSRPSLSACALSAPRPLGFSWAFVVYVWTRSQRPMFPLTLPLRPSLPPCLPPSLPPPPAGPSTMGQSPLDIPPHLHFPGRRFRRGFAAHALRSLPRHTPAPALSRRRQPLELPA